MTIDIKTESKTVEVETKEKAIDMICTTAFSMQLTIEELKEFDEVQRLANHFDINTDEIVITHNDNERDREQGYVNLYRMVV